MCPHILKKRLKPFVKSFGAKYFHKCSYNIPKGPPKERCGEQTKAETNVSRFKITSISRWKSSTKGKKSTSTNGWRR
jgi:hypothetical protein